MIFAALIAIDAVFAVLYFFIGMHDVSAENAMMENIQAMFLALACLVFVRQSFRLRYQQRLLASFLALLCFAFVFRELDVEKFSVPDWLIYLLADDGRAFYLVPLLVLFGFLVKELPYFLKDIKAYLGSKVLWYVLISAILYGVISELFDKKIIAVADPYFFEEAIEIVASGLLFCAACYFVQDMPEADNTDQKNTNELETLA